MAIPKEHRRLAFEHTRIESYPRQLEDIVRLKKLFPGGFLPVALEDAGQFLLNVPPKAGHDSKNPAQERAVLTRWVEEVAPEMETLPPGTVNLTTSNITVEGMPFPVTLVRRTTDPAYAGGPGIGIAVDWNPSVEEDRVKRYVKALEDKCPKLAAASDVGKSVLLRKSALVLEDIDCSLSGSSIVAATLVKAVAQVPTLVLPSEVVLVQDRGAVTLQLHIAREDGHFLEHLVPLELTPWDIDPARKMLRRRGRRFDQRLNRGIGTPMPLSVRLSPGNNKTPPSKDASPWAILGSNQWLPPCERGALPLS